jgi:NTE family protein
MSITNGPKRVRHTYSDNNMIFSRHSQRAWLATVSLVFISALQGCASLYKPQNRPITNIDNHRGYRLTSSHSGDFGDHLIFLAFSGGGTRAAALSYGILKEFRDTQVDARGKRVRLLDEVDSISSVSGGSFTAAYYGLFGDKTFTDYEEVFLRQSIQGTLIRKLFSPVYWWDSLFEGFDRTEMAIDYYDSHIFKGKTFADINLKNGPYIEINATDLAGGNRFSFVQASFDLLCSDLNKFSVARAVTASSAVPVAFPTVVLKNYAGDCDANQSNLVKYLNAQNDKDSRVLELKKRMNSYLDRKSRPYIHLVDGGIADNLGLRALADRIETQGSGYFLRDEKRMPKDVLVITVNAQVKPERSMDLSAAKPSVADTIDAMSDAQMSLYNEETKLLLQKKLDQLKAELSAKGHDVKFYTAEVAFDSVEAKTMKSLLNSLPTSLELSNQDVDILIQTASSLLRRQSGYKDFLEANDGKQQNIGSGNVTPKIH